jgi:hypothetical protein
VRARLGFARKKVERRACEVVGESEGKPLAEELKVSPELVEQLERKCIRAAEKKGLREPDPFLDVALTWACIEGELAGGVSRIMARLDKIEADNQRRHESKQTVSAESGFGPEAI